MNTAEQLRFQGNETHKLPIDERVLTEVDHLAKALSPEGGGWSEDILSGVAVNLQTAVQEGSMPYAVARVRHEVVRDEEKAAGRTFLWLGRSAVQSAMSGYQYHYHSNAIKRVDIEVDEARDAQENHRPGWMRVFISPKMSPTDAKHEDAKREHLANDDAIRISWLETDKDGVETERVMESLLVRDVPLEAWVAMLRDPQNIFGKSIDVQDEASALSVMRAHSDLEIPEGIIQSPVDIVEAVKEYITDDALRTKVEHQIGRYRHADQGDLEKHAKEQMADWLEFEKALAESLTTGRATYEVRRFIVSMQHHWTPEELAVINQHDLGGAEYVMSRKLAVVLENLKQNVVLGIAGAATGNEAVLNQLSPDTQRQIQVNQQQIAIAQMHGMEHQTLTIQNQRLIASENIKVGGGCSGDNDRSKRNDPLDNDPLSSLFEQQNGLDDASGDRKNWKWKRGVCRVEACSTRPGETRVGPCEVCEKCQVEFDKGNDPTTSRKRSTAETSPLFTVSIMPVAEQKAQQAETDKTPAIDAELQDILDETAETREKQELVYG